MLLKIDDIHLWGNENIKDFFVVKTYNGLIPKPKTSPSKLSGVAIQSLRGHRVNCWGRSIVCRNLYCGNRFVAHLFLRHLIQSIVLFCFYFFVFSFIAFVLDFNFLVLINDVISKDCNISLNLLQTILSSANQFLLK